MDKTISILNIGGVYVHTAKKETFQKKICQYLSDEQIHLVFTPNPEIILYSWRHPDYLEILNKADLLLPDGIGLRLLTKFRIFERIAGVDMAEYILQEAKKNNFRVVCLARHNGRCSTQSLFMSIKKKFPGIEIYVRNELDPIKEIISLNPQVILVGLGFPQQEEWLYNHRNELIKTKIGMAVGGTFDFWTGEAKRAPKFFQKIFLEWLWRLILEPRRVQRIFRAVIIFPLYYCWLSWANKNNLQKK